MTRLTLRNWLYVCAAAWAVFFSITPAFASKPSAVGGGYIDSGLLGEYYANSSFSGSPQFTRRDVRLDFEPEANVSWAGTLASPLAGYPADNFSVRWSGQLRARFAETYTFRAMADDAVVVKLKKATDANYTTVLSQGSYAPGGTSGTLSMQADVLYDIVVEYQSYTGQDRMQLYWSSASTPEEIIDVAAEVSINWHTYVEDTFADAAKNGRHSWEPFDGGNGSEDANGWPLTDCSLIISEALAPAGVSPLETGDMAGSFNGRATLSTFGNCEIVAGSVQYDSATNRTTFLLRGGLTRPDSSMIHLRFADTDRDGDYGPDGLPDEDGFTNLKVMRIDPDTQTTYPEDQIFNDVFLRAFDRMTAIRFQRTNDQAIDWADRTQPDDAFYKNSQRPYVYNDRYNDGEWNLEGKGMLAHEYEIMMCNELGADYYPTVPHLATATGVNSYMHKLARLIRYGSDATGEPYSQPTANPYHPPLNSNLRVYVEISNELWNFASLSSYAPYYDYRNLIEDMIASNDPVFAILNFDNLPLTVDAGGYHTNNYTWVRRYWAYHLVEISNTFREVFGDAEMPGNGNRDPRVRPFFTWQYGDSNATASTGLKFMSRYFNNEGGPHVATPRPPNYYFWSGGGAGYYSTSNKDGFVEPNPIPNQSFEAVSLSMPEVNPTNASWAFNSHSGIAPNATLSTGVTGQSVAATQNNVTGYVGHQFTVGSSDIVVYELGRYTHNGNVEAHKLHIARASDGMELTATGTITASSGSVGSYQYGRCVPIVLEANTTYYLFSSETAAKDVFGSSTTTLTTDGAYTVDHPATASLSNGFFSISDEAGAGASYGPLSIRYAPVWEVATGVPLNNPFTQADTAGTLENAGNQVAWLWSENGTQGEVSVSFTVPAEQNSNVYALSYRWCTRIAESMLAPDTTTLSITATVGGVDYDITPVASSTQPRPWNTGNEWRLVRYWKGNYYWSQTFQATAGQSVTITFRTTNTSGNHIAFLDDVKLTSNDAFYASTDLGAGSATGQTSARYPTNQYDDGKWCAAYGLMQMTYEHGFSAGGDAGNSPLQDYAKFEAIEAKQTAIDCLDVFQQAGGRLPTFGTYNIWPTFQNTEINGEKVFGTGNPEAYPLTQGIDVIMGQLPEFSLNGVEVPNAIDGAGHTLTDGGDTSGNLDNGEWYTFNFVVGQPGNYSIELETTGSGGFEWMLDGSTLLGTGTAGSVYAASDRFLDYGLHAFRVRCTTGALSVTEIRVSQVGAPESPVISSSAENNGILTVNWDAVAGADGYTVYWGTASGIYLFSQDVGTSLSYGISGMMENTQYFVSVRAYNASGKSLPSAEITRYDFTIPQPLLIQNFDTTPYGQIPDGWENETTNNAGSVVTVLGTDGTSAFKGNDLTLRTLAHYDMTQITRVDFAGEFYLGSPGSYTSNALFALGFSDAQNVTNPYNQGSSDRVMIGVALDGGGVYRLGTAGQLGGFNGGALFGSSFNLNVGEWYRLEGSVSYNLSTGEYDFSNIALSALGETGVATPVAISLSQTSVSTPGGSSLDPVEAQFVVVGNAGRGGDTIDNLRVEMIGAPVSEAPVFTQQPVSATVSAGDPVSFTVAVSGAPSPSIAWEYRADAGSAWAAISGASGEIFAIPSAVLADAGEYRAVATNSEGTVSSDAAVLVVQSSGGPSLVTEDFESTAPGNVPLGWELETTGNAGSVSTGTGTASSQGFSGRDLALRQASAQDFTQLEQLAFSVDFFFAGSGTKSSNGMIGVGLSDATDVTNPYNQGGANRMLVGLALDGVSTYRLATGGQLGNFNSGRLVGNSIPLVASTWYRFEGTISYDSTSGEYLFSDLSLESLGSDGASTPATVALSLSSISTPVSSNNGNALDPTAAKFVVVGNQDRGVSQIDNVSTSAGSSAPVFTTQPQTQTVQEGGNVTFTVAVDGEPAPTLAWEFSSDGGNSWNPISGATSETLSITGVIPLDAGQYRCVATNSEGSVTSDAAVLTVDLVPVITTSTLPDATAGQAYSTTIQATGGDGSLSWSLSGAPAWLSIDSATGVLSGTPTTATSEVFDVSVIDADGDPDTVSLTLTIVDAPTQGGMTGTLDREYWTGISGTLISSLTGNANYPNNPTGADTLSSFEAVSWNDSTVTQNWGDNYGQRIRGYIVPEVSANYTFWICGDDDNQLLLSTDANPANAVLIAEVAGWTQQYQWDKYTSQQSTELYLEAGQPYYVEALHKEGGGGDRLAVAWTQNPSVLPSAADILPATVLSSFSAGAPAPAPVETWLSADIGNPSLAGGMSYDSTTGAFSIDASGSDIWLSSDQFHFAYLENGLIGDGIITARVASVQNTHGWAKAGVMIRDSLDANSAHAFMAVTPGNGLAFQRRLSTGGGSSSTGMAGAAPCWVRVERSGDSFTGSVSTDGINWTIVDTVTVSMGADVQIGLALTSHNDTILCTAGFDNVTVTIP